jgi:two-component system, NtrC family, sensor kinase
MTMLTTTSTIRILVVDDSRNIHDDFRKVLARPVVENMASLEAEIFGDAAPPETAPSVHFEIDSAYQGDDAVVLVENAMAEHRPYALAFVDMRMPPGMDGLGTIAQLWSKDPQLQVVICSAYSDYSWSEIVGRLGNNDRLVILRKPFDNIEVLQLAHTLSTKWTLQQRVQSHLEDLEGQVSDRTRELRESQALFRLILENTNDLITVLDASRALVYFSPGHQRLLGYAGEDIAKMGPFGTVNGDDRPALDQAIDRVLESGKPQTVVYRHQHHEGFFLHFESHVSSARDENGNTLYLVITARDITERHQQEIQVRLNQKLESIGLLAAGIAHEINTPTQFISDNTRFLIDAFGQLERAVKEYRRAIGAARQQNLLSSHVADVEAVEHGCEIDYLLSEIPRTLDQSLDGLGRVAKIVRSLKEFSHPGSQVRSPMDVNRSVENAAMVCRHEWKYVADVELKLDPDLPKVPCLADEFNQAILNLVINAAHTIADAQKTAADRSAKGCITLRTRRDGDWAVVEVSDTGLGIPEAIRDRIFEPFFTTKPLGKGTGQGLAIVRTVIVGKHKGTVDFTTELGKGTTFRLRLPLVVEPSTTAAPS